MSKTLTYVDILEKFHVKHGNMYDYSHIPMNVARKDKIIVGCPVHGKFKTSCHDHLYNNSGCPQCAYDKPRKSQEMFEKEASEVHSNRYDYSLVTYRNNYTKVKIICPKHGIFEQVPYSHLNYKNGCPNCKHDNRRNSVDHFISRSNEVHHNKYDYSTVQYFNCKKDVTIICPEHGEFKQSPSNHLYRKSGCPQCAKHVKYTYKYFDNHKNQQTKGILYLAHCFNEKEEFMKIGITKHRGFVKRFEQRKPANYKMTLLTKYTVTLYDAFVAEQQVLNEFEEYKYVPNDSFSGKTECFEYSAPLVNRIANMVESQFKM